MSRIAGWMVFGLALLASSAIREGPSPVLNQAILWLPSGVAVAGVWLLGLPAALVIVLCVTIQRLMIGYNLPVGLPAAAGSASEALIGVLVLRRLDFRPQIDRLRDVGAVLLAACLAPLGSIFFSWIGRLLFWTNPHMPFYSGWGGWWRMNALGILTILPPTLIWLTIPRGQRTRRLILGGLGVVLLVPVALLAGMILVPPGAAGVLWLTLGLVAALYAGVRFGPRGASTAGALATITVAFGTARGFGPFVQLPGAERHTDIQLFELLFSTIPLVIGALVAERQAAQRRGLRDEELRRSIQSALPDITYRIRRDGLCLDMHVPPGIEPPVPREEIVGHSMFRFFTPGQGEIFRAAAERTFADGMPVTLEFTLDAGGRRRVREARCVASGQDEILAVVRDITDRKWAEETMAFEARVLELVATRRRAADVFAAIVAGIEELASAGVCSISVLEENLVRMAMAPSLPPEFVAALDGRSVGPGTCPCGAAASLNQTIVVRDIDSDPLCRDFHGLAQASGFRACWSIPIRNSEGRVLGTFAVYYREQREPEPRELALAERAGALAGIALERELRIDALRRSEELLASINRNVQEGLFRTTADLRLIYANLAMARLLGYESPQQILDLPLADAFEDPRRPAELTMLIADQGHVLNEEVRFRRRDGGAFWGLLSGTGVRGPDGAILYYDVAIADITARKELEEQFRQAQKMEAVGKLAGGVAHDFNNLLTVIFGYAETIRAQAGDSDRIRHHSEQILGAARRASGLTRQLLAYSRQQVLSPQVLELSGVVDQLGDLLRRLIGEDIGLIIQHRSGPCWVRVDRSQIEQVLMNLAVNARDAMPRGGRLTISTTTRYVDGAMARRRSDLTVGSCVALGVSDTGIGMTGEIQGRAFDPFFTTKEPGKGTGLGLATVYGIVKQSGGAVWLESTPGSGTTVWIYLPQVAAPVDTESVEPTVPAGPMTGTVLLVEDEPVVRQLVRHTLELVGHQVLEAVDGEGARELARQFPGSIDLVITDVIMPRLDGRDLARDLRISRPGLRFLFISGYPNDARELGDFVGPTGDFLAKPFTPQDLTDRVGALLAVKPAEA